MLKRFFHPIVIEELILNQALFLAASPIKPGLMSLRGVGCAGKQGSMMMLCDIGMAHYASWALAGLIAGLWLWVFLLLGCCCLRLGIGS